jgi:very-short-patch-repair endonuclease
MKAIKESYNTVNKYPQKRARRLSYRMTKAETLLWNDALRRKLTGYTFYRQRPVVNYIADFLCKELNLVIEVDGYSRKFDEVIANDKKKQEDLELAGYTILRFKDEEVLSDLENVKKGICETIDELKIKGHGIVSRNFPLSSSEGEHPFPPLA